MTAEQILALGLVFGVGFLLPIVPIFPLRLAILIPLAAAVVHPLLVVLAASIGSALGTIPLYAVTSGVRTTPTVQRWLARPWFRRMLTALEGRMFLTTLLFALLPLPDQLMSVVGGLRSYPVWRMAAAFFLGRLPYYLLLATIGAANSGRIQGAFRTVMHAFGT